VRSIATSSVFTGWKSSQELRVQESGRKSRRDKHIEESNRQVVEKNFQDAGQTDEC